MEARYLTKLRKMPIDRRLGIVIDGKVLAAPVIRERIPGGSISFTGDFSQQEAQKIADRLNFYRKEANQFLEDWGKKPEKRSRSELASVLPVLETSSKESKAVSQDNEVARSESSQLSSDTTELAIDLIHAKGLKSDSPTTWIGYEEFNKVALKAEVVDLLKKKPKLEVTIRASSKMPYEDVAELVNRLQSMGVDNVALEVSPPREILAFERENHPVGSIRGSVNGNRNKYNLVVIHEDWKGRLGELPGLIVNGGEAFEFRNVPVGKCTIRIWPAEVDYQILDESNLLKDQEVVVKSKEVVDVELDTLKKEKADPTSMQKTLQSSRLVQAWHKKNPLKFGSVHSNTVPLEDSKAIKHYVLPFELELKDDVVEVRSIDVITTYHPRKSPLIENSPVWPKPLLDIIYFEETTPRKAMQSLYNQIWAGRRFLNKQSVMNQMRNQILHFEEETPPIVIQFWDSHDLLGLLHLESFDKETRILKLRYKLAEVPKEEETAIGEEEDVYDNQATVE